MRTCSALIHVLLLCGVSVFPACLPSRVTIDLASRPDELRETRVIADEGSSRRSPKVVVIDVEGMLSHAPSGGIIAGRANSVDDLAARLDKAEHDWRVKAVVLRINSPGGTVAASETMYHEIAGFRERSGKPVVVSMGEVAASGGYYISLAGDRVIAQETSVTGSVGVIFQTINFSKGMAMIGIEGRALTSGRNKDLANPLAPIRDEQYAVLQRLVDDFYASFRGLVLSRRPGLGSADTGEIEKATDGRVFTGKQALEIGLVDALGGLRDAYAAAKQLAGIERAQLVKYHGAGDKPLSAYASAAVPDTGARASASVAPGSANVELSGDTARSRFLYLWDPRTP